jgi:hypothetical protein
VFSFQYFYLFFIDDFNIFKWFKFTFRSHIFNNRQITINGQRKAFLIPHEIGQRLTPQNRTLGARKRPARTWTWTRALRIASSWAAWQMESIRRDSAFSFEDSFYNSPRNPRYHLLHAYAKQKGTRTSLIR